MKRTGVMVFITLILVTLACNAPGTMPSGSAGETAVALTVAAQLTMSAGNALTPGAPTSGVPTQPTLAPTSVGPSATLVTPATATLVPSNTPTVTQTPIPCNWAQFVADITYPDDTEVTVNSGFVKTWRLKNVGSCTWTSGYQLVFSSGDQMGAANSLSLTSGSVPPGGTVDVSVSLTAPGSEGTYKGYFKIKAPDGSIFGIGAAANGSFWVQIKAVSPAAPPPVEPPLQVLLPDLVITDITWTPANPKKNQVTHIKVSTYNNGPGSASQFTIKWWGLSTFTNPSCSWDIMDVNNANGGRVLECDFTYISIYPANLQTKAVIDTSNHVNETNEGNNTFLKTMPAITE
jgi:hypothetical protein